ncbi:MAG TPA: KTSC domain-containing protein [Thermoanaerobaculia bacterium]|nr:KTSC domain-containing protein [Thermoanaerobaculia bacterium]
MRRRSVSSSSVASVGYDPKTQTLEIEFSSGSVYEYNEVPPEIYKGLMEASSKGRYFANEIRGQYPSTRI